MSLYKVARGWGVDYRDEFGRRHRKFVGAEEAARAIEAQLTISAKTDRRSIHNFEQAEHPSLDEAAVVYLTHLAAGDRTKSNQRERLERLSTALGPVKLAAITPAVFSTGTRRDPPRSRRPRWPTKSAVPAAASHG